MGDWLYSPTGKIVKGVIRAKRARITERTKEAKKEERRKKKEQKEERRKKKEERRKKSEGE